MPFTARRHTGSTTQRAHCANLLDSNLSGDHAVSAAMCETLAWQSPGGTLSSSTSDRFCVESRALLSSLVLQASSLKCMHHLSGSTGNHVTRQCRFLRLPGAKKSQAVQATCLKRLFPRTARKHAFCKHTEGLFTLALYCSTLLLLGAPVLSVPSGFDPGSLSSLQTLGMEPTRVSQHSSPVGGSGWAGGAGGWRFTNGQHSPRVPCGSPTRRPHAQCHAHSWAISSVHTGDGANPSIGGGSPATLGVQRAAVRGRGRLSAGVPQRLADVA